jgi:hypothetical protein
VDGNDVHLFQLTVMEPGRTPFQAQVGNGLPATALPVVDPGTRVKEKLGSAERRRDRLGGDRVLNVGLCHARSVVTTL